MPKPTPVPLDGTVSAWLIPFLRVIKVDPAPTVEEIQRWLDVFYPEVEAQGHAQSAHLPTERARRSSGWANTKALALIRFRFYLTRSPRELRTSTVESSVESDLRERLERFDAQTSEFTQSLEDLGIPLFKH